MMIATSGSGTTPAVAPVTDKRRNETVSVLKSVAEASSAAEADDPDPDFDEELLKRIDERDLRKIFRGLCGG